MTDIPWSAKDSKSTIDTTDELMLFVPSEPVTADKNKTITGTNVQVYTENITLHTGVRTGMSRTINADTTRFDVAAGNAIKVDRTDPLNVIVTKLAFAEQLGILDTNLTATLSHVYVDIVTGVVTTELNPPTLDDLKNRIYLGENLHDDVNVIVKIVPNPIIAHGTSSTEIVNLAFGGAETLIEGMLKPNGVNLMLDQDGATLKQQGRGFAGDPNNPNIVTTPAQSPIPITDMFLAFIDGSGNLTGDPTGNVLDPLQYNLNGTGTLVNVPNNRFQKLRVFEAGITNDKVIYYGTEDFANSHDALNDSGTVWVEHVGTRDISPKAIMALRQDVTDLIAAKAAGFFVIDMIRSRSQI